MSTAIKPKLVKVVGFDIDHPEFTAEVWVSPNGKARMSNRTGWTRDSDLDRLACEAALRQVRAQRQTKRIRMKIRRKKNPETGKEVMDRSARHAVIKVWPKSDKRNDKLAVNIHFSIGEASGDFILENVIQEVGSQTIEYGKTIGTTQRYVPYRTVKGAKVRGDDEWWAARSLAIRAIKTELRKKIAKDEKVKKAAQKQADKKAEEIRSQGGEQLLLI